MLFVLHFTYEQLMLRWADGVVAAASPHFYHDLVDELRQARPGQRGCFAYGFLLWWLLVGSQIRCLGKSARSPVLKQLVVLAWLNYAVKKYSLVNTALSLICGHYK
jgi:hypothetical protein